MRENKDNLDKSITTSKNGNLKTVRQHFRNKLIKIGLDCQQTKIQSQIDRKRSRRHEFNTGYSNLPNISALNNSLNLINDEIKIKEVGGHSIFSQRDLFLDRQFSIGSNANKSKQIDQYNSSQRFSECFRQRVLDNVKQHKLQGRLPSVKRSFRSQKVQTQANGTIFIHARNQVRRSKQTIHVSPKRQGIKKAKTEEIQAKVGKIKKANSHFAEFKHLTPWAEAKQMEQWKHQF